MAGIIHHTEVPALDPSTVNIIRDEHGALVTAYYSPPAQGWLVYDHRENVFTSAYGIDTDWWPELWHEITSGEVLL